jgi:hypothetical protein
MVQEAKTETLTKAVRLDERVRSCCVYTLPNPPPADEKGSVLVVPKHSWLRLPGVKNGYPYVDAFFMASGVVVGRKVL